jgi:alkane 1-monooxygenase
MKIYPYTLPAIIVLVFVVSVYLNMFWMGPFLIPIITLFNKTLGEFTNPEITRVYHFFHHSKSMALFKRANGVFFILFQVWVGFYLWQHHLSIINFALFAYSIIILTSNCSISLAHDLMHSSNKFDRFCTSCLLLMNGFFYLEADHVYIHHRFVGTPNDPASAKINEGLYPYLLRSISGRMRIIFGMDNSFPPVQKKKIVEGNMLRLFICIAYLCIAFIISFQFFLCVCLQYIFVTLIYEVITYIQHYGLTRSSLATRPYQKIGLHHSWNCYYKLSAYLHFMMPVHSIHHVGREPELQKLENTGPAYPRPFSQMVVLALLPPLWFKYMNPRVKEVLKTQFA